MNILLLAGTKGLADEGAVNVSREFCERLSINNNTLCISATSAPKMLGEIKQFKPDIIHSIHGPSVKTFALLLLLRITCPKAKFFATLTLPTPGLYRLGLLLRIFRFINLITQAPESEKFFASKKFSTQCLSHGIDTEKFHPVEPSPIPEDLEKQLNPNKKMLMHVGHLKPVRGMDVLAKLAKRNPGWQIVMIGSKRFTGDKKTVDMLTDADCIVYQDFIQNLPALYCRADAYIFPVTHPYGAIDTPLTVLEATACNRPVICAPYKALPRFFPKGDGVYYFNSIDEASIHLKDVADCKTSIKTREKALKISWDNIISKLSAIYSDALSKK